MNEKYIVFFMSKTKKKMIKFIENQLQEKGLDDIVPSYGNILTVLYDHNKSLTMKEIGALLGKEKSTITTLVNKLEKLGYIKKVKRSSDQRTTYVCLTEKGLSIEKVFAEISAELHSTAYHNFTLEEKKAFLRLLKKMNQNFNK
ncbi:MAG: MarR family transcriptional regulator [Desulfobacterales bacterium]|nr:MarR family transcriptional regulator [Desulfobacterales bacterium]